MLKEQIKIITDQNVHLDEISDSTPQFIITHYSYKLSLHFYLN